MHIGDPWPFVDIIFLPQVSWEALALLLQATQSDVWEGLTTSPAPVHAGTLLQDTVGILFLYSLPVCQSATD